MTMLEIIIIEEIILIKENILTQYLLNNYISVY